MKQLVNKAASGDSRLMQFLFVLTRAMDATVDPGSVAPLSSEADAQTKKDIVRRMQQLIKGADRV